MPCPSLLRPWKRQSAGPISPEERFWKFQESSHFLRSWGYADDFVVTRTATGQKTKRQGNPKVQPMWYGEAVSLFSQATVDKPSWHCRRQKLNCVPDSFGVSEAISLRKVLQDTRWTPEPSRTPQQAMLWATVLRVGKCVKGKTIG